jgi:ferrous iron transport protein B
VNTVLLVGNPNVGKSAIFSRLTGAKVIISNYPGTTVEFTQGRMKVGATNPLVIDVPGSYTLEPTSKAEEVALEMLEESMAKQKGESVVVNVVDATNLERNLYLTHELLERNIPVILALNIWDDTKHKGIEIDVKKLEKTLKVPVVPTCGLSGEGIKELIERLPEAKAHALKRQDAKQRWQDVGKIIQDVQKLHHRHHTLLERLEDASVMPLTGFPIALGVVFLSFLIIRSVGEGLIGYICEPLFEKVWAPLMLKVSALLGSGGFVHDVLIGNLIEGGIDFKQSFGLLTTGLFIPLAAVLPYIISFYLVLGILEDFGYLPRLAVLVDNLMHRLGLHGYAVIPMILGLGCNVPGVLGVRLLEGRRERFIAATLMAIGVPCMAQSAMIVGLVGARGGRYVAFIFLVLFALIIGKGLLLNRVIKGTSPEILTEMPPYRIPQPNAVIKKLWMRIAGFLKEALPYVLMGILVINILYIIGIIDFFAGMFAPILVGIWGLPKEAIAALLVGFLRKDVAIGMLGPLNLTTKQLIVGSTVLSIYFPCVATFVMLVRELGARDMLKAAGLMVLTALVVGGSLNLILSI